MENCMQTSWNHIKVKKTPNLKITYWKLSVSASRSTWETAVHKIKLLYETCMFTRAVKKSRTFNDLDTQIQWLSRMRGNPVYSSLPAKDPCKHGCRLPAADTRWQLNTLQFGRQSWLINAAGPSHSCAQFFRHEYMTLKSLTPGRRNCASSSFDSSARHPTRPRIFSPFSLHHHQQRH